jgi:hypothetical protein
LWWRKISLPNINRAGNGNQRPQDGLASLITLQGNTTMAQFPRLGLISTP